MTEQWKPVPDFPDYEVSNMGNCRRCTAGQGTKQGLIKPAPNKGGYAVVSLRRDGKTYSHYMHDLVGRTFVKGWKPGLTVNHRDRNRLRNSVDNLEFISHADNSGHGRLAPKTIYAIKQLAARGFNALKIAKALGVRPGVVQTVLNNGQ